MTADTIGTEDSVGNFTTITVRANSSSRDDNFFGNGRVEKHWGMKSTRGGGEGDVGRTFTFKIMAGGIDHRCDVKWRGSRKEAKRREGIVRVGRGKKGRPFNICN